jgi:Gram-negative bacterial TonB protein C-terminal
MLARPFEIGRQMIWKEMAKRQIPVTVFAGVFTGMLTLYVTGVVIKRGSKQHHAMELLDGYGIFPCCHSPGHVRDVKIVTPVGLGLDEEGIKVVNKWRFEPGQKDGVPVAVRLNVSMSPRMY